jgi:hypothetical protein
MRPEVEVEVMEEAGTRNQQRQMAHFVETMSDLQVAIGHVAQKQTQIAPLHSLKKLSDDAIRATNAANIAETLSLGGAPLEVAPEASNATRI